MADKKTSAIIPAAGASLRLKDKLKKQYAEINGKHLLYYCLASFESSNSVDEIVIVVPEDDIDFVRSSIVEENSFSKVSAIVEGGELRQDSVKKGFDSVDPESGFVIIHDAARPFIEADFIDRILNETYSKDSVISAIPVRDTLKVAEGGIIKNTTTRNSIWRAQTPQAFNYEVLSKSYKKADLDNNTFTDEAQIVEYAGYDVHIVEGSEYNFKITGPEDMRLAELIINSGQLIN